jgi:hypothetical protein
VTSVWRQRRFLGLAAVAAVVVGLAALAVSGTERPHRSGPVTPTGVAGYSARLATGDVIIEGSTYLSWDFAVVSEITVTDVEPVFFDDAGNLEIAGVYIAGADRTFSLWARADPTERWPPASETFGEVHSLTAGPVVLVGKPGIYDGWNLLVGVRAVSAGVSTLEAWRVHYTADGHRHTVALPRVVTFCTAENEPPPPDTPCDVTDDELAELVEKYR